MFSINYIPGYKDASPIARTLLGDDVRPGAGQADHDGSRVDHRLNNGHGFFSGALCTLYEQLLVLGPREAVSTIR